MAEDQAPAVRQRYTEFISIVVSIRTPSFGFALSMYRQFSISPPSCTLAVSYGEGSSSCRSPEVNRMSIRRRYNSRSVSRVFAGRGPLDRSTAREK